MAVGFESKFLSQLATGRPRAPGVVYSATNERPAVIKSSITVVFGFEWPERRGRPLDGAQIFESTELISIASEIYRVLIFLQSRVGRPMSLLDIRQGCLRVRYAMGEPVEPAAVLSSLRALMRDRDLYCVSDAFAHVHGRSIEP